MKRPPKQGQNGQKDAESVPATRLENANDRDPSDEIIDSSMPTLSRAVETLGGYLDRLGGIVAKADNDRETASHYAWMTKQVSGILAELRRLGEARAKVTERLDVETVLRYLRTANADKRSHILREVAAMDNGASVLA